MPRSLPLLICHRLTGRREDISNKTPRVQRAAVPLLQMKTKKRCQISSYRVIRGSHQLRAWLLLVHCSIDRLRASHQWIYRWSLTQQQLLPLAFGWWHERRRLSDSWKILAPCLHITRCQRHGRRRAAARLRDILRGVPSR
jgi:hypothetical protein